MSNILRVRDDGNGDYSVLDTALDNAAVGTIIEISGPWDSDDTTNAVVSDNNVIIRCVGKARHNGYWDTTEEHYRLVTTANGHALTCNGQNVTIDGLAVGKTGGANSDECIRLADGGTHNIDNCLVWARNQTDCDGIYYNNNATVTINVTNTIVWNAARAGIQLQLTNGKGTITVTLNVNSCTIWDCNKGNDNEGGAVAYLRQDGTVTFENNIYNSILADSEGTSTTYENFHARYTASSDTNKVHHSISTDGFADDSDITLDENENNSENRSTTDGTPTANQIAFVDITSSPPDLRLQDHANNEAQEYHTDNAGPNSMALPYTDILNVKRESSYDVGAHAVSNSTEMVEYLGMGDPAASIGAITPGVPEDLVSGDILLLHVECWDSGLPTLNTPGDWTAIANIHADGTNVAEDTQNAVWWHSYSGTDPDAAIDDTGNHTIGLITAWRNVDSTPIDASQTSEEETEVESTTMTGITTGAADAMVVLCNNTGINGRIGNPFTNSNLENLVPLVDFASNVGNDGAIRIAAGIAPTTAAIGNTTVSNVTSTHHANIVLGLALSSGASTVVLEGDTTFSFTASADLGVEFAIAGDTDFVFTNTGTLGKIAGIAGDTNLVFTNIGAISKDVAIAGDTDLVFTSSATISKDVAIAGDTDLVFTNTGTLGKIAGIAGDTDLVFTNSATISKDAGISGDTDLIFTNSATISKIAGIAGDTDLVFTNSATISKDVAIAGDTDLIFTNSATISKIAGIAGDTDLIFTNSATISKIAGIAGDTDFVFTNTGDLSTGQVQPLAGDTTFSFTSSSNLGVDFAIAGDTDLVFTNTANISKDAGIAGDTNFVFTPVGDLITGQLQPLAGDTTFSFTSTSNLGVEFAIAGDTTYTFTPSATLGKDVAITGDTDFIFTNSATISKSAGISGDTTFVFTPVADIDTGQIVVLSGNISYTFTSTGNLGVEFSIAGDTDFVFTSISSIAVNHGLAGNTNFIFTSSGLLQSDALLEGNVSYIWTTDATLQSTSFISGDTTFTWTSDSTLQKSVAIAGDIDLALDLAGQVTMLKNIYGNIDNVWNLIGLLEGSILEATCHLSGLATNVSKSGSLVNITKCGTATNINKGGELVCTH